MKDLIAITSCSERAGLLDILERQLRDGGIDFYVNPIDAGMSWTQLCSMGYRLAQLEKMLDRFPEYDRLIFVDAWDTLFIGTKGEVIEKIPETGTIMAAERNPFPDPSVAALIPDKGLPWRFANGGGLAGTKAGLREWVRDFREYPDYTAGELDQSVFNRALAAGLPFVTIDRRTSLFYCMYLDAGELANRNGRPVNSLTGETPCFIHFNGHADAAAFLRQYGIG